MLGRPSVLAAPPRGRALCLAPHPDDEILGCGGALALHRAQGDAVRVVIAFDGRLGLDAGLDPALRRAEALRGGAHLGLDDYVFLDHPEGHVPARAELERGARELRREIARFAPSVVYLPWRGDDHVDHRSLAAAAQLALVDFAVDVWCYEVWSPLAPERVLDLGPVWQRLCAALGEHGSQLARDDLAARLAAKARSRGARCASGRGEAFARARAA
jgi:LmbE family N-acetylglucosaminyl deacetylase